MRLTVACRPSLVARIGREAKTPDDTIGIVREAIEDNPTLVAMGENRVGEEEALELASKVMDAMRPRLLRVLARRSARRGGATRGPDDEGFMDEMERRLREEGHL
jgi:hypothetical protein